MIHPTPAAIQKLNWLNTWALREFNENLLPFWGDVMFDPAGGFYGAATPECVPVKDHPRSLIYTARYLWTYSAAYVLWKTPRFLEIADHAYAFLVKSFLDPENGGAYYLVSPTGAPLDDRKVTYATAFCLYGLSEYYRATQNPAVLAQADAIQSSMETHMYDPAHNGYREQFTKTFDEIPASSNSSIAHGDKTVFTMNTHLHILEAYAARFRAHPDERSKTLLDRLLHIQRDRVLDPAIDHFQLFFDENWVPQSDPVSYGHDIEGSWLIMEAAELIGPDAFSASTAPCLKMAEACLREGMDPDGSMLNELVPSQNHLDSTRVWWVEAEAVVGYLNAYQLSGSERYLDAAYACAQWIESNMIDKKYGEWHPHIPGAERGMKAEPWKAPYHNGRMCMEIVHRCHALLK